MRTFAKIVLAFLAVIGFLALSLFLGGVYLAMQLPGARTPAMAPAGKMVLSIDLDDKFIEGISGRRLQGLNLESVTSLEDAIIAIRRAKTDDRVVALKATIADQSLGLAQIQDLRDSIADFRAGGKPTMLFSESMGEGEGTLPTYYLAASFGDIWVQPSGTVGIAGIGTDNFFLKKFLDRFGVKANFIARGEFKSAPETITNTAMSPANREETQALIGSWFNQMIAGIGENRKLDEAAVKALVNTGPLMADEALKGGLIDHIGYRDEFDAAVKAATKNAAEVQLARYVGIPRVKSAVVPTKRIAVIYAVGEITRGDDEGRPLLGGTEGIHSEAMVKAIRKAADDSSIEAIVLRVDSPGGSYVASDTIWRALNQAKAKHKPIIVSMGDTAASGGYFISMGADRIFAEPATVTGSIGVFTGKVVVGDALAKYDINHERIAFGDSAGTYSAITEFTPKDVERINHMLDATYADFTGKAAQGRGKTQAEIDKIARGRVWSGSDAIKVGLVDELGGFTKAVDYAKTRIGLKAEDQVTLVPFPEPNAPWLTLFKSLGDGDIPASVFGFAKTFSALAERMSTLLGALDMVQARGPQLYAQPVAIN